MVVVSRLRVNSGGLYPLRFIKRFKKPVASKVRKVRATLLRKYSSNGLIFRTYWHLKGEKLLRTLTTPFPLHESAANGGTGA